MSTECIDAASFDRLGKDYGASTVSQAAIYKFKRKNKQFVSEKNGFFGQKPPREYPKEVVYAV